MCLTKMQNYFRLLNIFALLSIYIQCTKRQLVKKKKFRIEIKRKKILRDDSQEDRFKNMMNYNLFNRMPLIEFNFNSLILKNENKLFQIDKIVMID